MSPSKKVRFRLAIERIHSRGEYPTAAAIRQQLEPGTHKYGLSGDECRLRREIFKDLKIEMRRQGGQQVPVKVHYEYNHSPSAPTVGELITTLKNLVNWGLVDAESTWHGWDDGSIILNNGFSIESGINHALDVSRRVDAEQLETGRAELNRQR